MRRLRKSAECDQTFVAGDILRISGPAPTFTEKLIFRSLARKLRPSSFDYIGCCSCR